MNSHLFGGPPGKRTHLMTLDHIPYDVFLRKHEEDDRGRRRRHRRDRQKGGGNWRKEKISEKLLNLKLIEYLPKIILIFISLMCMCLSEYHMCVNAHGNQDGALDLPELDL